MARGLGVALLGLLGCGRVSFDPIGSADAPADSNCPTCDDGLIAHWTLDETDGIVAHDAVGGHDGPVFAATDWRPTEGIHGGALALDESYVEIPWDASPQIATGFTVALWVRLAANRYMYDRYVASYFWDGVDHGVLLMDSESTAAGLRCAVHASQWSAVSYPSGVDVDRWTHVACSYDGSFLRAYIGGVAVAGAPVTGVVTASEVLPVLIGGSKGATLYQNQANGLFDDVRVYARALAPSELAILATP